MVHAGGSRTRISVLFEDGLSQKLIFSVAQVNSAAPRGEFLLTIFK